jgi:nitroreductase
MTTQKRAGGARPVLAEQAGYLIAIAARAPSVHNTQPWRFRGAGEVIELYADPTRKLKVDPLGREMLISCGAALFGLRLAVRSLGYLPLVHPFPDPSRLRLLARLRLGGQAAMTETERRMLLAVPHRHTHRGPFDPAALPAGLLAGLQHDAIVEGASLALIDEHAYGRLAAISGPASRVRDHDRLTRAEMTRWTRGPDDPARDGVPARAFPAGAGDRPGWLPQRDFDLGRRLGQLSTGGPPPPVTAILMTSRDGRADWLRAGQALHRLLLHAASQWVFASLYTQPLEASPIREQIRRQLKLHGWPQVVLQLGVAHTAAATARRPVPELAATPGEDEE